MTEHDDALRLDRAVDELLAGRPAAGVDAETGALLERLVDAHRGEPPPALAARAAAARRTWLPARAAAAVLALLFLGQALGSLFAGDWVARELGVAYDAHAAFEGGILLVALGSVLLAGAAERRFLDVAVAAGAPVGLAFAIHGGSELSEFPAGGILHLAQGVAAVALAVLWWRARRYVSAAGAKDRHGS